MQLPGKPLQPIIELPAWISLFGIVLLSLVFISPSWLPEPDPGLKLEKIFFTYEEDTDDPAISREVREAIELPHDWRHEDFAVEAGWYEFLVSFDEPPTEKQVLYITHVQQQADIWFDDIPISSHIPAYVVSGHIWSRPLLLPTPRRRLARALGAPP